MRQFMGTDGRDFIIRKQLEEALSEEQPPTVGKRKRLRQGEAHQV